MAGSADSVNRQKVLASALERVHPVALDKRDFIALGVLGVGGVVVESSHVDMSSDRRRPSDTKSLRLPRNLEIYGSSEFA